MDKKRDVLWACVCVRVDLLLLLRRLATGAELFLGGGVTATALPPTPMLFPRNLCAERVRTGWLAGWLAGWRASALLRRASEPSTTLLRRTSEPSTTHTQPLTTHHPTQTLDYRSTTVPSPVLPDAPCSLPKNTPRDRARVSSRRKSLHEIPRILRRPTAQPTLNSVQSSRAVHMSRISLHHQMHVSDKTKSHACTARPRTSPHVQ